MRKGLDVVPLRIPEKWNASWFERFVRETLALADVRNATEGGGISITGQSSETATIAAAADVQALLDASLVVATDSSLDNQRLLTAGDGIVITDGGAGGAVTVETGNIPISKLQEMPEFSVLGVPYDEDDDFGPPSAITADSNDLLLGRVSDVLGFTFLTAGMFPDSMVDALSSTEFGMATALFDFDGDLDLDGTDHDLNATNSLTLTGASAIALLASSALALTTGTALEIFDAGDTDSVSIAHDGTDLVLTSTNTGEFSIDIPVAVADRVSVAGSASGAWLELFDTGAVTDRGLWTIESDNNSLRIVSRADDGTFAEFLLVATRDGTAVDDITFAGNEVSFSTDLATFSGESIFTNAAGFRIQNSSPGFLFDETDVGGDGGIYRFASSTGTLAFSAIPDSEVGGTIFFRVQRTGTNVDEVFLQGDELVLEGDITNQVVFTATPGTPDSLLGTITLSNEAPLIYMIETDAAADEGFWRVGVYSDTFRIETREDDGSSGADPLQIQRTGTNVDLFILQADEVRIDGPLLTVNTDMALEVSGLTRSGASVGVIDINYEPADGTGAALYRFGRTTSTSGENTLLLMRGNGSTASSVRLVAKGSASTGGHIYLVESAAAHDDLTGWGQIWVRDDTPNTLWFTDDAGNDSQVVTQETGSFTATLTGMTSSTTGTMNYLKIGNLVALWVESSITGTSNSTGFGATGVPSNLRPTVNQTCLCARIRNNSAANYTAYVAIGNNGALTFFGLTNAGAGTLVTHASNWTNSGLKGIDSSWMIVYAIN